MENRFVTYLLDGASGSTFLAGLMSGQTVLMILGGAASVMAFINHFDQIIQRRKKKKDVG